MRSKSQKQLYFKFQSPRIKRQDELLAISKILESLPGYDDVLEKILKDLTSCCKAKNRSGRRGMTAEQVLRSLFLRTRFNYSYRKLADATEDSISVREFLKIRDGTRGFKYKTLQSNIKLLKEDTLDLLNEKIKNHALSSGIENGQVIRTDGLATASNIHHPTDWSLMNDSIRIITRVLTRAYEDLSVPIKFTNHYRSSKKKLFKINNTRSPKKKRALNLELIRLCRNTLCYAQKAVPIMESSQGCESIEGVVKLQCFIDELKEFMPLVEQVIDQAYRRIVLNEKVPANEKLFSLFESHTDIIVKGKRGIVFGHKSTITTGKSGLILNVFIHEGNPADATLVKGVIENHINFYGSAPQQAVFDGCYYSIANQDFAKSKGIKDICFSKEPNGKNACSRIVGKILRNFRAGIEAAVSFLKRILGLTKIMDRGFNSFKKAVKASIVTFNLFKLSRIPIKV